VVIAWWSPFGNWARTCGLTTGWKIRPRRSNTSRTTATLAATGNVTLIK
jgi:hypothetical protein